MYFSRSQLEDFEEQNLAPYACHSRTTKGRAYPEDEPEYRTPFQRDRDRILHTTAFRRLEYKTQVFMAAFVAGAVIPVDGGVTARMPVPDLSAAFKWGGHDWGYLRVAGILRYTKWDDIGNQPFDISGDALGWGVNASTNVNLGKRAVFRGQVTYGEGIQNYMNDSPVDLGPELTTDPKAPLTAVPLPIFGMSAYLDLQWSEKWTSTVGYSRTDTDNSDGQAPDAFKTGQYASANVLWYPVPNLFVGAG